MFIDEVPERARRVYLRELQNAGFTIEEARKGERGILIFGAASSEYLVTGVAADMDGGTNMTLAVTALE